MFSSSFPRRFRYRKQRHTAISTDSWSARSAGNGPRRGNPAGRPLLTPPVPLPKRSSFVFFVSTLRRCSASHPADDRSWERTFRLSPLGLLETASFPLPDLLASAIHRRAARCFNGSVSGGRRPERLRFRLRTTTRIRTMLHAPTERDRSGDAWMMWVHSDIGNHGQVLICMREDQT